MQQFKVAVSAARHAKFAAAGLVGAVALAAAAQAQAAVIQIAAPDAAYVSATTLLAITAPDFDIVTGLGDSDLTLTFDASEARTVGVTWLTWGSQPDTEGDSPRVLFSQAATQITFDFSRLVSTFGFEAEPDLFTSDFTVEYYRGGVSQGTITRTIDGLGGARLLAASGQFDKAVVTSAGDPFAFGQVRYALSVVPEPATWGLMILGFGGTGVMLRRARRTGLALA
ncbi:PEPxxWA-CTERM sorting domain-containing protein [Phenylobacterium sp.]|uniref:PEPxxWA-CTERM sorting domain-containing protein n=1 Tax=Phenylobacterium sp. TaxID=1871053 RepID=UPI00286D5FAE|nr:PEPxxWA-CTERM sorting domain-containing protein [Phenylobacterium sp.]